MIVNKIEPQGYCGGVIHAIKMAMDAAKDPSIKKPIYMLGQIIHNSNVIKDLERYGIITIFEEGLSRLLLLDKIHSGTVIFSAHGVSPKVYEKAKEKGLNIIDATCPVVLRLQQRIKAEYLQPSRPQIAIFGKRGHAEVLGLVGQTEGQAVVVEQLDDLQQLDFDRDISLFSQTTKSPDHFRQIVDYIRNHIRPSANFRYFDTICRQVSGRMSGMIRFAQSHDALLFVSGLKSSNGRALFAACRSVNPNAHLVEGPSDICFDWFKGVESLGICGATSTPTWLMEDCKNAILNYRHVEE